MKRVAFVVAVLCLLPVVPAVAQPGDTSAPRPPSMDMQQAAGETK
ncbi:MAG: hypothetical protein ABGY72_11595 [bacterium]